MKNKELRIFAIFLIALFFPCLIFIHGCNDINEMSHTPELADLTIAGIDVVPLIELHPIFVAEDFGLDIAVRNIGPLSSGGYIMSIEIEEIATGLVSPIGTFNRDPVPAGEILTIYSTRELVIDKPGSYRINVELIPNGWEDANLGNNTTYHDFNAVLY